MKIALKRFEDIRVKHMLCRGNHPLGECFELGAYGKSIVKKEGARANLSWSEDGKSFSINDKQIVAYDFARLHKEVVNAVAVRTAKLMLSWSPVS